LPFMKIASWPLLGCIIVSALAIAALQWFNASTNALSRHVVMVTGLVFTVLLTRLTGTLFAAPVAMGAFALALASRAENSHRPLVVVGWAVAAQTVPIVLELAGILAPTFAMTEAGLVSYGTVIESRGTAELAFLLVIHFSALVLVGVYAGVLNRRRVEAQRATEIQAWHLRKLLPH